PEVVESVLEETRKARGGDARFDSFLSGLENDWSRSATELEARRLAERMALALEASLLIRHSIVEVADAFCASRLAGDSGRAYGTLPPSANFKAILNRAY
ncbi:MAG TPA: hypothetical protein VKT81_03230, partial [Bryobacteraceae bacterium]|nr:hypothetical protein [Bryobacteraceae bacterium]